MACSPTPALHITGFMITGELIPCGRLAVHRELDNTFTCDAAELSAVAGIPCGPTSRLALDTVPELVCRPRAGGVEHALNSPWTVAQALCQQVSDDDLQAVLSTRFARDVPTTWTPYPVLTRSPFSLPVLPSQLVVTDALCLAVPPMRLSVVMYVNTATAVGSGVGEDEPTVAVADIARALAVQVDPDLDFLQATQICVINACFRADVLRPGARLAVARIATLINAIRDALGPDVVPVDNCEQLFLQAAVRALCQYDSVDMGALVTTVLAHAPREVTQDILYDAIKLRCGAPEATRVQ